MEEYCQLLTMPPMARQKCQHKTHRDEVGRGGVVIIASHQRVLERWGLRALPRGRLSREASLGIFLGIFFVPYKVP